MQLHPDLGRGAACCATPSAQFRAVAFRAPHLPPAAEPLPPGKFGVRPPPSAHRAAPNTARSRLTRQLQTLVHKPTCTSNLACDLHPAKRGSAPTTASFVAPFAGPCRDGPRR